MAFMHCSEKLKFCSLFLCWQAFAADPTCHRGYGILSTIYLSERAAGDLEKMMPLNWHFSEDGDSEMWTALACLLYSNNSLNTAAYFAQRVRLLFRSVFLL